VKVLIGKHEVCQPLVANMETTELRKDICSLLFQSQFKTFPHSEKSLSSITLHRPLEQKYFVGHVTEDCVNKRVY